MIPRCRWTYWHIWSSQEQPAKPEFPGASKTTMICLSEERSLLLLLLSPFSRVLLCVTPKTAAHQAPLSLGFSRQEYWSGLPFPSPMHESEKWEWSRSVMSDFSWPHGLQPIRLLRPWDFPGKSTGVGCHCLFRYNSLVSSKLATEQQKHKSQTEYKQVSLKLLKADGSLF